MTLDACAGLGDCMYVNAAGVLLYKGAVVVKVQAGDWLALSMTSCRQGSLLLRDFNCGSSGLI